MLMKIHTEDSIIHMLMPTTTAISVQPRGDTPQPYMQGSFTKGSSGMFCS